MDEPPPKPRESFRCFPPLPLLKLGCILHGCPSPSSAFRTSCSSQQPVQLVLVPIRYFDVNANCLSVCSGVQIWLLRASKNVKTSSLSGLLLPSSQPAFQSKYRGCYVGRNYATDHHQMQSSRQLLQFHPGKSIQVQKVFFQARIQLCMLMLSGGWASERNLPDVQPFHIFHPAGCTHHSPLILPAGLFQGFHSY